MKFSTVFFSLALGLSASSAFAAGVTVTNNSGLPIDELFASAPGKGEFGKNIMEGVAEGMLDNGKTVEIGELADGTYDLKLSAPDESVLCTIPNIVISGGKVELTADNGKACK